MTPFPLPSVPAPRSVDVIALGENSVDLVALAADRDAGRSKRRLSHVVRHVGGQAATAAVAAARLGCRARYVGALGADEFGDLLHGRLTAEGVDVQCLRRTGVPTRSALILVEPDGDRTVYEHCHPELPLRATDVGEEIVTSGRVLIVDATSLEASCYAVRVAREAGVATIVDVDRVGSDVDALLETIDVIITPEPFALERAGRPDVGEATRRLASLFPRARAVIVTRGERGAVAIAGGRYIEAHGYRVEVVDTTGAGDAFRGGFGAAWARLGPEVTLESLLAYANATAALNCRAVGAQTSLPSWAEVSALVTS